MKKFNWSKAIGYGMLIWAIMALLVKAAYYMGIIGSAWTGIILVMIAALLSYSLGGRIDFQNGGQSFEYGLSWIIVGFILDLIITMQVYPAVVSTWFYWVGYALILFAPEVKWLGQDVRPDIRQEPRKHVRKTVMR